MLYLDFEKTSTSVLGKNLDLYGVMYINMGVLCILLGLCGMYLVTPISHGQIWAIVLTSVVGCLLLIVLMSIATQPTSNANLSFKVPLVPLIPALSILFNIYLMLMLDMNTWIRFAVWMTIGLPIYFFSVRLYPKTAQNSSVRIKTEQNGATHHANGKSNGHVNHAFRQDEEVNPEAIEKTEDELLTSPVPQTKTKYPAPPPPVANDSQLLSIDLDLALAALDDVLFVEECRNRKVSAGTISNGSKGFSEHDVVALVHREDVKSSNVDVEKMPHLLETAQSVVEEPKIERAEVSVNDVELLVEEVKLEYSEEVPKVSVKSINPPVEEKETDKPLVDSHETTSVNSDIHDEEAVLSPPPPPLPVFTSFDIPTIPRITSVTVTDIKSVTLRSRRPETPPIDYDEPADDHLVFGTLEHKNFKSRLEGVLTRNSSVTSDPVSPITPKSPRPKTVGPSSIANNEFVVQDRIRTSDARKTLSAFFLSDKAVFQNGLRPISNGPKVQVQIKSEPVENSGSNLSNSEALKLEHRERMAGTLRSIRLRKVDSFKNDDTQ